MHGDCSISEFQRVYESMRFWNQWFHDFICDFMISHVILWFPYIYYATLFLVLDTMNSTVSTIQKLFSFDMGVFAELPRSVYVICVTSLLRHFMSKNFTEIYQILQVLLLKLFHFISDFWGSIQDFRIVGPLEQNRSNNVTKKHVTAKNITFPGVISV